MCLLPPHGGEVLLTQSAEKEEQGSDETEFLEDGDPCDRLI
jgi:hypothetical protein